jgi:hypothetical protein
MYSNAGSTQRRDPEPWEPSLESGSGSTVLLPQHQSGQVRRDGCWLGSGLAAVRDN